MIMAEQTTSELAGNVIKDIFRNAKEIADLHACLTSPRGDNFRLRLIQLMETPATEKMIDQVRAESGVNESHRHTNMLLKHGLASRQAAEGEPSYVRTDLGERAINCVRELERRIGQENTEAIFSSCLGVNSIRLFLRVYGNRKTADWGHLEVRYTPAEIGKLSLFLPRAIEGISAIDKLNVVGLLVYQEDDYVYMPPVLARAFYQYLQELSAITMAEARISTSG